MDDILDIIKTRRSVRKYSNQEITEEQLKKILEAGRWSPSAVNRQPWSFVVVKDKEARKKIGDASKFYLIANKHVSEAPVIIAVCVKDKTNKWAQIDCGMASQNIMLEAHSIGLGTCFCGLFDEEKIKQIIGLPESMSVLGLITLGYPEGETPAASRLEIDNIVSYESYDSKNKSSGIKTALSTKRGILSFIAKFFKR